MMGHRARAWGGIASIVLAAVLATGGNATAWAGERLGPIEVGVLPLASAEGEAMNGVSHGYVEFRVRVKNSSAEEQTVRLSYPGGQGGNYGAVATRTVKVAGGQESEVSLYQTASNRGNFGGLEFTVDGISETRAVPVTSLYGYGYGGEYDRERRKSVLLSRGVPQDFRESPEAERKKEAAAGGRPGEVPAVPGLVAPPELAEIGFAPFFRSELPVRQWSGNWLGYSCYDAVLLTAEEAAELPAEVQLALRRFVECGGALYIQGGQVPAAFTQGGIVESKQSHRVGFGRVVACAGKEKSDWEATRKRMLAELLGVQYSSERPSDLSDMLVAETTVPVRALFGIVLVFGILMGPVNVWILTKRKKRIWLWWNVPVMAFVACGAILGYSLVSEGWTSHGKMATLTFLDERCHRATTIGYASYYCPLTPSGGLQFGVDTEIINLERPSFRTRGYGGYYGSDSTARWVDWTSGQRLASGWAMARVPAYLRVRKNEDRRERLVVEKNADGSLKVVNALGADIREVWVADASGRVFSSQGSGIPAGAEQTLQAAVAGVTASAAGPAKLRDLYCKSDWLGELKTLSDYVPSSGVLAPGGYIAILDKSPFLETALPGTDTEDSAAIVVGVSKGHDNGR
jgi:hypothetical protein